MGCAGRVEYDIGDRDERPPPSIHARTLSSISVAASRDEGARRGSRLLAARRRERSDWAPGPIIACQGPCCAQRSLGFA